MDLATLLKNVRYALCTLNGLTAYDTAAPLTPENAIPIDESDLVSQIDNYLLENNL